MPFLEIRRGAGPTETRELAKTAPLLVGRHAASDIRIDDEAIAAVHCRFSWNKLGFEVVAATAAGVMYNGRVVRSALLSPGDTVRIGEVELVLCAEAQAEVGRASQRKRPRSPEPDDEYKIAVSREKPLIESGEVVLKPDSKEKLWVPLGRRESSPAPQTPATSTANPPHIDRPPPRGDVSEELEILPDEEPMREATPGIVLKRRGSSAPEAAPAAGSAGAAAPAAARAWGKGRPLRPGDQEAVRSPLVLGLTGAVLFLLLGSATLWLIMSRESTQRQLDTALAAQSAGAYAQAIELLEQFLKDHPRHKEAASVKVALATARVDQATAGAVPAWDRGLEALNRFIEQVRDTDGFHDPQSEERRFAIKSATRIALGAAKTAGSAHQAALLAISAEAGKVLEHYSPADLPPAAALDEIAAAVREAEASILRQDAFDLAAKEIDAALADQKTLTALDLQRQLLGRYADLARFRPLQDRLKKILNLEKQLTVRQEQPRDAETAERPSLGLRWLSLDRRTRTRSDEASVGETVFAVAEECCYGVDTVTGEPQWRRVIGPATPFFPMAVSARIPGLLVYDAHQRELQFVVRRTGQLRWRQTVEDRPGGAPLVHEGQIFLATQSGKLLQIDLETGRLSAQLVFTQPLAGTPVLSPSRDRLYVAGRQDLLYVLTRRPLACEQVLFMGHAPGGVAAPLLMLRDYLLVAENDRLTSCRLRVFRTVPEDQPLREIAAARVDGQVHDAPVLRGKELFVASTPERVSALTVAETDDTHVLTPIATHRVKDSPGGALYLAAGPDDQLWLAGAALRRFQLTKDSFRLDKKQLALGLAAQPLQATAGALFAGRRLPFSRAVLFIRADREQMIGQWQVALGAAVLECTRPAAKDGSVICVNALGDLFHVGLPRLVAGGFEVQTAAQLPLLDDLPEPLIATGLADGRLAVACGGNQPRVWVIDDQLLVQHEFKPAQRLEAAPVLFAGGLLLPTPGRLVHQAFAASVKPAEDFRAPMEQAAPVAWKSLASIDDTQAVALDAAGRLFRVAMHTDPVAHLAEVARWKSPAPVDLPVLAARERIFLADSTKRLTMLDASSLEPLATSVLDLPATQSPWLIDNHLLIELGGERLACFDAAAKLEKLWDCPLAGAPAAGAPLPWKDQLLLVLQDGRLALLDRQSGKPVRTADLEQTLAWGPRKIGEQVVVGTLDGSLVSITTWLDSAP